MRLAPWTLVLSVATTSPLLAACNEFHIVASCTDGLKNGVEVDVDCGGDTCPRCALGQACNDQPDCFAGDCIGGFCTPPEVGVWTQRNESPPDARFSHVMVHDGTATLLFGGTAFGLVFADTWSWDGVTWSKLSPAHPPPGRSNAQIAYDAAQLRAVLFGGVDFSNNPVDDTWSWDTKDWTSVPPTNGPPFRGVPAMAYDTDHGEFVLFGGIANGGDLGDTWTRRDGVWQMHGAAGPPSRHAAVMAYDEVTKQAVLFGGGIGPMPPLLTLNDTWIWDGATWTNAAPDSGAAEIPGARHSAAMAYDRARGRLILFGGTTDNNALDDTWEWDARGWHKMTTKGPQGRHHAAMAYDPTRGRIVLFGGTPDGANPLNDTWEYHQIGNPCRSDAACDTGHCVDGLCCESAKCDGCQACNSQASPGVCTSCGAACNDAGACAP